MKLTQSDYETLARATEWSLGMLEHGDKTPDEEVFEKNLHRVSIKFEYETDRMLSVFEFHAGRENEAVNEALGNFIQYLTLQDDELYQAIYTDNYEDERFDSVESILTSKYTWFVVDGDLAPDNIPLQNWMNKFNNMLEQIIEYECALYYEQDPLS
ncbi:hypothetical protein ACKGJO_06780 [Gracilimonas sp. Q87]|uniref:hypothetical protein n=1 Tax=Gracilimonas sp. Q87 TaxID=3384766 RepID=UPI003983DF52